MPTKNEVLETFCRPATGEPLGMMAERKLATLHGRAAQGRARDSSGARVADTPEDGLAARDGPAPRAVA